MNFCKIESKSFLLKLIQFIIILDISICIVVFPFKTILKDKNEGINEDSKDYNSTHFMNDYFTRLNYIPMKIGNPPQEVNILLTYQDCGFKIGKAKKCIYLDNYLSYYNRNSSLDFKYTNYSSISMYEFRNQGSSAEDTICAYTDLELKNLKNFSNIGFYLGTDTNESICGVIGFKMDGFDNNCGKINNIIKSFNSQDVINNYQWVIKYNTIDEGLFILGGEVNEIIKNYDDNNLINVNTIFIGMKYCWGLSLQKIIINNNQTINTNLKTAEIDNDFSLIKGGYIYYEYIEKNFFKEYYSKDICVKNIWSYDKFYRYYIIECDKEKFGNDDIKKFPNLSFIITNSESILNLEGKDLFTETKYKFFFNVVFPEFWSEQWIFGKIFLKKFPTIIDFDKETIKIYNNYSEKTIINENKNFKFNIFLIIIIIVAFIIFGLLCYLLGKNLNKIRKKKANELNDDDYDYTPAKNDNNIND